MLPPTPGRGRPPLQGLVAVDKRSAFRRRVTVGHLAIGFAAGRVQARGRGGLIRQFLLFGTLSVLPDLDLVAVALHHSRTVLGHRGVTHSLMFAAIVATLVAIFASRLAPGSSRIRTFAVAFLVGASHAVLDPLCAGSSGTRLLWPFTTARVTWGSFQPFPDALSGSKWLDINFHNLAVEFLFWSPLLLYALWPRVTRRVQRVDPAWQVLSTAPEPVRVEEPAEADASASRVLRRVDLSIR